MKLGAPNKAHWSFLATNDGIWLQFKPLVWVNTIENMDFLKGDKGSPCLEVQLAWTGWGNLFFLERVLFWGPLPSSRGSDSCLEVSGNHSSRELLGSLWSQWDNSVMKLAWMNVHTNHAVMEFEFWVSHFEVRINLFKVESQILFIKFKYKY